MVPPLSTRLCHRSARMWMHLSIEGVATSRTLAEVAWTVVYIKAWTSWLLVLHPLMPVPMRHKPRSYQACNGNVAYRPMAIVGLGIPTRALCPLWVFEQVIPEPLRQ